MTIKFLLLLTFSLNGYAQVCYNNIPHNANDSRYEIINGSGGSEVLDKRTKLIWQRCSIGQTWSGNTCSGDALRLTWVEALREAKSLGNGYRLSNIRELSSLIEYACYDSSINMTIFPNTPPVIYWSSSPSSFRNTFVTYTWLLSFGDGSQVTNVNYVKYMARAVRISP